MAVTVRQLAELVGGSVVGDGDILIQSARPLQDAQLGDITFADTPRQRTKLEQCPAAAAVVPLSMPAIAKTLIQVADPLMAFVKVFQHLQAKPAVTPTGIDARAILHNSVQVGGEPSIAPGVFVDAGTTIGKRCRLFPGVVVGQNCQIGDDVVLHPNVVIYDDTVIGHRVILHANTTIGADGFGYRIQQTGHVKVPQLGNVVLGDDVEIGANSTVDRGTFGSTRIGDGCKLDNLVQIGHNCQIGKHNVIAAHVGVGGSSSTGSHVFMGGQAGVADHVTIGDGAMLSAQTGVFRDIAPGKRMILSPATEEGEAARIMACWTKLPAMRKDLLRVLKELKLTEATAAPEADLRKAS